ncbi:MAG TPA: hypothetical protein V6C71_23700 [Coleofasciculaceae cyanobacterium]|jgi:hypothetical protein
MWDYFLRQLNINTLKKCLIKSTPYSLAVPIILSGQITRAQNLPSGTTSNNTPNINNLNSSQLNNIKPIQQPSLFIDSDSGSRQFFDRGKERLFFLPDKASEPILQIDEAVETDAVNQDDLPKTSPDE